MGYLIAAIIAFLFLSRGTALSSLLSGLSTGPTSPFGTPNVPSQGYVVPPNATDTLQTQQQFSLASQGVGAATTAASDIASKLGSSLGSAIPIVGAALSAVIGIFAAASAKRAAQARSENQAVANAVPGWDKFVTVIVNNYNSGQFSAGNANDALDASWRFYWQEVGPQIQPGRNGCQTGTIPFDVANRTVVGIAQCQGDWGASCCVGYSDLANSITNMKNAIAQTESNGKPASALILAVYASKYGGINRPAYTLTFTRPSPAFIL